MTAAHKAQTPMIYRTGLSPTWWIATKWKDLGNNRFEALEKFDISDQINAILDEYAP